MLTTASYKTITQIVYHHHLFCEIITISRFMKHHESKQNHNVILKKYFMYSPSISKGNLLHPESGY